MIAEFKRKNWMVQEEQVVQVQLSPHLKKALPTPPSAATALSHEQGLQQQ